MNVIGGLGRGGAERLLVTTHRYLDRTRFEPAVATLFGPNPLAQELRDLRVPVYELALSGPLNLPRGIVALRRLIKSQRIEVVHTHLYYANIAGRIAALGRARVISTLHNPDYTHEDPGSFIFRGKKLLDRLTAKHINVSLVAVSDEVRRDFEGQLGLAGIRVLHNYMDVADFQQRLDALDRGVLRKALGLADHNVAVLHVGRLHHQKGQDLLIDAFARARVVVPGLVLFLVGEGALRKALEERARAVGLGEAIKFVGALADVTPYYRMADLFAFPSRYEAFGIALLEAMAAALPIVAANVGGIAELTTEDAAILVPAGGVCGLAKGLVSLATDPKRRNCLAAAARDRATRFDVRLQLPYLEELYASL